MSGGLGGALTFSFPNPVIPAKAGIQTVTTNLVTRNQVQIADNKSPLPSWVRAIAGETPALPNRNRQEHAKPCKPKTTPKPRSIC